MDASRQPARTFQDLGHGNTEDLKTVWEAMSRLLNACSKAIPAAVACHSDSRLPAPDSAGGFV